MPQAVRTPVKEPGPAPKAMASHCLSARPASASKDCTMGKMDWEWVRTPDDSRVSTVSPFNKAQDAISDEVSIARMIDIPYFNPSRSPSSTATAATGECG